jgi:DNA-binding CsgD family transcriptional regulator
MQPGGASTVAVLEREREQQILERMVAQASGGSGGVIIVEGQAGVGKTRLLRIAGELGETSGMRVLRGRGSELDRGFGFGLVRSLLERAVSESPELLEDGAQPAAAVFGAASADDGADPDLFVRLLGLYWLVAELSARRPLLILADDLHWADTASLRWLAFVAERVEDLPVLIVCAARPDEPGADQAVIDAVTAGSSEVLRPAPLSAEAAITLIRARLPDAADQFGVASHRATGGNPFLLGELVSEFAEHRLTGSVADASEVIEFGSERVGRAIRRRLRSLPDAATTVARALAVLGPPAPLEDVIGLTGLQRDTIGAAVDALAAIDVIVADHELDFVHPIVRAAIYDQTPVMERQRLHAGAAELMQARGVESEQVGRHLLPLPGAGDAARVTVLRAAAREADARGAADAAVGYLRRALEEPPDPDTVVAVLHELGLEEAADRRRQDFDAHLRRALALAEDPRVRTRIALDLGRAVASCGEFRGSVEIFRDALEAPIPIDDADAVALEGEMLAMAFHEFTCTSLAEPYWQRRFVELERGLQLAPSILAPLVVAIAASRPPAANAIALAERVLATGGLDAPNSVLVGAVGNGLIYAGALARAVQVYGASIAFAAQRGNRLTVAWQSTMRSKASLRLGELRSAEADARLAVTLFEVGSGEPGIAWCVSHLLDALLARGSLDEADELVGRFSATTHAGPTLPVALLRTSLAHLYLARGHATAALREARAAGQLVSATISNPYCCDWRAVAAQALLALGRVAEAQRIAEDELADARRYAIPEAEGASLRTLGLILGGADGVAALRASVAVLDRAEGRLEHARSLLELGIALRLRGDQSEARGVLQTALDEASGMGASGIADRAHGELIAGGARLRRDHRALSGRELLTASEDRVAVLAAGGLSNRDIAQRQFVTVKTVQSHLRDIYRKLDVSARDELPVALGIDPEPAALA